LDNPRYTGYAVFGRWARHETLIDPDDVAAGNVARFRRAEPGRIARSRVPAHPEIVSVELFTEAQLRRRERAAGGLARLYRSLDVSIRYEPEERAAYVTTRPRVDGARVRRGT
jgi:hypothetical protein